MEDDKDDTSAFLASLGVTDDFSVTGTALVIENDNHELAELPADEPDVDQSVSSDFTLARANIIDATNTLKEAVTKLIPIAEQSQHPRAFEVLGGLVKTMLEAQQDLMNLHKKKEDLKPGSAKSEDTPGKIQTTNNLFVGSTAEMQKILDGMRK